jgi:hypothetical protein
MITAFERIPELFVSVYDADFQRWGRGFRKIGSRYTLRLKKPVAPLAVRTDGRVIVGVVLKADVERAVDGTVKRVVIMPADEANAEAIRRHTADLKAMLS